MTRLLEKGAAFESLLGRYQRSSEPAWLDELRTQAASAFASLGIPTQQEEEWRFTPLGELASTAFVASSHPQELTAVSFREAVPDTFGGWRIVAVNGRFSPELSRLPDPSAGIRVLTLAQALAEHEDFLREALGKWLPHENWPFVALNTARFEDAIVVIVRQRVQIPTPLEVLFWSASSDPRPFATHPRVLVYLERESQLSLIEIHGGQTATYLSNPVVEISLESGARMGHYRVQCDSPAAFHIGASQTLCAPGSSYHLYSVAYGAKLSRADLRIRLGGPNASALLYGLYRIDHEQVADLHSVIDHAAPHCQSWEVVKGILEGRSRGIFNGRIIVRPGAQKTDAKQTNKNLLLSREAIVHANPQLEIYADDVRCTHGATVGHIDEQSLFYLRSRGIAESEARGLLTYAFANDVLRRIELSAVREWLERHVLEAEHITIDEDLLEVV